jgi:hypothetical protein
VLLAVVVMPSTGVPGIAFESGTESGSASVSMEIDLDDFDSEDAASELESSDLTEQLDTEIIQDVSTELPTTELTDLGEMFSSDATEFASQAMESGGAKGELDGRSGASKGEALKAAGGNSASEEAVKLALDWIVRHQLPDGSWNLDHTIGPGRFRTSPDPGEMTGARNGATALALLPLLGAGKTHVDGQYKDAVTRGLEFLKRNAKKQGTMYVFWEEKGTMYSHGLASIVFCEAYAMTKDESLRPYAQGAVKFIEYAQDRSGGGWRYEPRSRGDTSAVGWQLMALKSAKISGFEIDKNAITRLKKFLNSVSDSRGAHYGYLDKPNKRQRGRYKALTAVGLLCRMYTGWDKRNPGLLEGCEWLADRGPDVGESGQVVDMYYNYYATQTMKHMYLGSRPWTQWNTKMRDFLIDSQSMRGVTAGSWGGDTFGRDHASRAGGRLFHTSLACMTLEVYYRFLPLYESKVVEDSFEFID